MPWEIWLSVSLKEKKKSFPENDQKAETVSQAVLDYGLTP